MIIAVGIVSTASIFLWLVQNEQSSTYINKNGYVVLTKEKELEHRYLAKQILRRHLERNEIVHHINENKADNSIENLMLVSRAEHAKIHIYEHLEDMIHAQ